MRMEQITKSEIAQNVTLDKKFSCRSCWDSNPQPLNHESGTLTTEPSPLPNFFFGNSADENTHGLGLIKHYVKKYILLLSLMVESVKKYILLLSLMVESVLKNTHKKLEVYTFLATFNC